MLEPAASKLEITVSQAGAFDIRSDNAPSVKRVVETSKSEPQKEEEEKREDTQFYKNILGIIHEHMQTRDIGLDFSIHEETGRTQVTVRDKETGEVIREIPQEQALDLMAKIEEMIGILFESQA